MRRIFSGMRATWWNGKNSMLSHFCHSLFMRSWLSPSLSHFLDFNVCFSLSWVFPSLSHSFSISHPFYIVFQLFICTLGYIAMRSGVVVGKLVKHVTTNDSDTQNQHLTFLEWHIWDFHAMRQPHSRFFFIDVCAVYFNDVYSMYAYMRVCLCVCCSNLIIPSYDLNIYRNTTGIWQMWLLISH